MTLGLRANNPWNLQASHVAWLGETPDQTENGELCFDTMVHGIRAGVRLCYTYEAQNLNTPLLFISKFSPSSAGNPTAQYVMNVCQWTGFQFDQSLNFHDSAVMVPWAQAIFRQEQGPDNGISAEQIQQGIEAANG